MNFKHRIAIVLSTLALLLSEAKSEIPAASDDFSSAELSSSWAAPKGEWSVEGGKLKGAERKSDEHAAVLFYKAVHTDSKVGISFRLAGSEGFHLSFNHPKGHLFRVLVSESQIAVRTDKDKKDPASKPEMIGKTKVQIQQGEDHTLTCETAGEHVTVLLDGKEILKGSHPALAKEKTGYRLVLKGKGVLFDDFVVSSRK